MENLEAKRKFLVQIATAAGQRLFEHFRERDFTTTQKEGKDVVEVLTEADLETEQFIKDRIVGEYPESEFLAEETAPENYTEYAQKENLWIIDPIDGTSNFARGNKNFSISIAFVDRGKVKAAVVAVPALGKIYEADALNESALLNGKKVDVSDNAVLSKSIIACDWPQDKNKKREMLNILDRLTSTGNIRQIVCGGSSAADLAALSGGESDIYIIPAVKPWDVAAASLIVQKSGGTITRLDGKPWDVFQAEDGLLATNGHLHDRVVETLKTDDSFLYER